MRRPECGALDQAGPAIFQRTRTMSTVSGPTYGLNDYVNDVGAVLDRKPAMPVIVREVSKLTKTLCADDRWLDERHRLGNTDHYTRHLLHKDPKNRFVVLSLVWMPGQGTPIHDHACWGAMGLIENSLEEVCYDRLDDGSRPGFAELKETRGPTSAGARSPTCCRLTKRSTASATPPASRRCRCTSTAAISTRSTCLTKPRARSARCASSTTPQTAASIRS